MTGSKRWLDDATDPGARALRQAMDEARPAAEDVAFAKQRVWGRVQAPWWGSSGKLVTPEGRPRVSWLAPLLAGAGVALVASVTVLVVLERVRPPSSPVASTPAPGAPAAPAELAPALPEPILTTGPERRRRRLARGVDAELSPRTALLSGDGQTAPEVKVGRVRFSVPHQAPGERYRVRAGNYQVVVLGTTFDVAVGDRGVSVEVVEGTVEVQDAASEQQLRRLTAGQRWSSSDNGRHSGAVRAIAPARRPERPARRIAIADAAGSRALAEASEKRARDPERALDLYQKIVDGGGPLAETALYEMASVQDQQLHDPRRAAAILQLYRDRYPRGLLRAEADLSTLSVWSRLGETGRALQEARAFLERHPRNERRAEVARVAGDLARGSGDCVSALAFYDLALAIRPSKDDADADDALFYRAVCLSERGDPGSTQALHAYLGRFPLGRHAAHAQRMLGATTGRGRGP